MDLNSVVGPIIAAVLPPLQVTVRISDGQAPDAAADGGQIPAYETPGGIVASITGSILSVGTVTSGVLAVGQTLSGAGVALDTLITEQLSGPPGGPGTYALNNQQTVASVAMTTSLVLYGSVQALTTHDLRQVEGINLQGAVRAIYFEGRLDGVVRPLLKGGDLCIFPDGTVWLVTLVSEPWSYNAGWTKVIVTLQNRY